MAMLTTEKNPELEQLLQLWQNNLLEGLDTAHLTINTGWFWGIHEHCGI